jgi:NitT/TauT family transport system ATP-binding protein
MAISEDGASAEALRLDAVTLDLPGSHRPAIVDVSLRVARHRLVAVIGPSGCGKSTIRDLAAGLLAPTKGAAYFDGARRRDIGSLIDSPEFSELYNELWSLFKTELDPADAP